MLSEVWSYTTTRPLIYLGSLNLIGVSLLSRAIRGDCFVLGHSVELPRWTLLLVGFALQLPSLTYLLLIQSLGR
jgi:hypothetical protein